MSAFMHFFARAFLKIFIVRSRYRIRVQGLDNLPATGGVLLLGNHASWIDWAVVQIASPRPVRVVVNKNICEQRSLKWFFKLSGSISTRPGETDPEALKAVAAALQQGDVVCLFPEGVVSRNGHLADFSAAHERACARVDDSVVIVPFYLRGLWGSQFSRVSGERKRSAHQRLNRDVVVDFGPAISKHSTAAEVKEKVGELSLTSWQAYAAQLPTLGEQWINAGALRGNPVVLIDTMGARLRAKTALTASIIMARRVRRLSPEQNIGILLPSSSGSVLANLACTLAGKTVVNLNFTASPDAMLSAIQQAEIRTIYTSARFIERLRGRGIDIAPLQSCCRFVMLEDFRAQTGALEKLLTLASCHILPRSMLKALYCRRYPPGQTAVILFSSGSEGAPKGVMLSHRNLMTNVKQIAELLNMDDDDVMLASLPPFHAFGLTVTHFMPLLERVPVVCHADPTDVHATALAIAQHKITAMFGTSSFYRLYNRNAKVHPLLLDSLKYVIAGAEKLQTDVRRDFRLKFNKDILEGYGATETSPVASVNMPDRLNPETWQVQIGGRTGSVGLPIPGTRFCIVDPDTFAALPVGEAGMILIAGPQVMEGYHRNAELNAKVLKVIDGRQWYVTGDKGYLDADGFLFIIDRYSRFAKIGGEMVGLGAVETILREALDDQEMELVVINLQDERKGEKLVALCTRKLDPAAMREKLTASGLSPLAHPALYFCVSEVPKLGSGKTDFAAAKRLGMEMVASCAFVQVHVEITKG